MLESVKKFFWKLIEPLFPTIRDIWVGLGFMRHDVRQPYHYGWLQAELNELNFRDFLEKHGFEHDYIAWIDPDEVVNMRKVVTEPIYPHTFNEGTIKNKAKPRKGVGVYQYHLRLFKDGELRGHFEYTGESHPFKHLFDIGLTNGAEYIKPLLEPIMTPTPAKSDSKLPRPHSVAGHRADNDANQ
ncbi:MAG: hypothetical protein HY973_02440 [Candidatus Kerfeldbacteria bacterium]|nr:hypothetical protein [Candidatus Kerfeldbacteria bacterium]